MRCPDCNTAAICSTGSTWVEKPALIALLGIPSYFAVDGSCTSVMPPAPRMARKPNVPSVPVPERMMPIALSPQSSASERKNASIGMRMPRGWSGTDSCIRP